MSELMAHFRVKVALMGIRVMVVTVRLANQIPLNTSQPSEDFNFHGALVLKRTVNKYSRIVDVHISKYGA